MFERIMKQFVIDDNDVKTMVPLFSTKMGSRLVKPILSFLSIDKVNALYSRCCHKRGAEFASLLIKDLGIDLKVRNGEILENLPEGAFITVSNHPFGAIDGISLISLLGSLRPDFKVMVNSILTYIEAMSPSFISVAPYESSKGSTTNIKGVKETLKHIKDGHPIGFFPAGGVSGFSPNFRIEDGDWADSIIRLIKQSKVNVVPIYYHGRNSLFFYSLGFINWKLRSLRLPTEVFRKQDKSIKITIGDIISAEEIAKYEDLGQLGRFLKEKTYMLKN